MIYMKVYDKSKIMTLPSFLAALLDTAVKLCDS